MFTKEMACIGKDQRGFTLIELLVVIAITSIITLGLVMSIFHLYNGHAQASGEANVIRQVQNAGYYISRDTQMARQVSIDSDPDTPEVVTLTWYWYTWHEDSGDRDGDGIRTIYTLEEGRLYRNYYYAIEDVATGEVNEDDYTLKSRTLVAEYISVIDFSLDSGGYKLTVTASIDGIAGEQVETRTYEAKPRPNTI